MKLLPGIHSPEDIRGFSDAECRELAREIRETILHTVSRNGGHLSSNLGMVELTVALHRVFHVPEDKIVFDVGHQTYAHKLLTGRYEAFGSLRTHRGICGFPRRSESPCDVYGGGHASTSISVALGLVRARDLRGEKHHVVAVIGDGAATGGISYEALSDAGYTKARLIVVLNDNGMSISNNVGALSLYFSKLRNTSGYIRTKQNVKTRLEKLPVMGKPLYKLFHYTKTFVKRLLISEGYFGTLGFHYIGPVDGHNITAMEKAFRQAEQMDEPVLIHCQTIKGFGYPKAEKEPDIFHGTSPFPENDSDEAPLPDGKVSCGEAANRCLVSLAARDSRICVITAAMPLGTGTCRFESSYPTRFFDVGIAEEHAAALCAGLASGGMIPFLFVYSTFLQRGYDQVLNDICMQGLHTVIMLDRAGFSGSDGKTHHGIYDIAYLRHIPGISILAPASNQELEAMIPAAICAEGTVVIRYPKAFSQPAPCREEAFTIGKWQVLREGERAVLLGVGSMLQEALELAERFGEGVLRVVNASTIKPLDVPMLLSLAKEGLPVITLEEHSRSCGFGSSILEWAEQNARHLDIHIFGIEDMWIEHGQREELLRDAGLDADTLYNSIRRILSEGSNARL